MAEPLLQVENLAVHFGTELGVARAVDGVDLRIGRGETFCLVGESGCGKTVTALAIMGLVPSPPGRVVSGSVRFDGRDLLSLDAEQLRRLRGAAISMVFQEPMSAFNPVFTVGTQLVEALTVHQRVTAAEARARALEMLRRVGVSDPERRLWHYPHQFSGGMLQRVMIAMALMCGPKLLIADEPTTAVDVTVQAQILALLRQLQRELGMAVMLITHDLGVVAQMADRVAVMYAGRIVEEADVYAIFRRPLHPYLKGLLRSLPAVGRRTERLEAIPGQVPDPRWHPPGCRFHPRCPWAVAECSRLEPELREVEPGHRAACIRLPGYWPPGGAEAERLQFREGEGA